MRVGVLSQDEEYLSLAAITDAAAALLARSHAVTRYHWCRTEAYDHDRVRAVFRACDVVVSLGSRAPRADRRCGTPGIFLAHAWMDHAAGLNLYITARNFRQADTLTFASWAALRKYRRVYPRGPRAVVLPYFVPALGTRPHGGAFPGDAPPDRRRALASRYGLPAGQDWVLYAGRLCAEKNTVGLVRMWSRLRRQDAVLVLAGAPTEIRTVGFGPPADSAELVGVLDEISAGKIEGIRWIGPRDSPEIMALMRQSRVVVNPTLCFEEDFGLVAAEAMAAGTPVVCADWGGLRDIVHHGATGYRARTYIRDGRPWLDEAEFCEYLCRVLDDSSLREAFASAAHTRALREYAEPSLRPAA